MKAKVLIITPGGMPVPAVRGGAVQNLIEHLININNLEQIIDMTVICPYDDEAKKESQKYNRIKFVWIHIPKWIQFLDLVLYHSVKFIAKEANAISFRSNFKILYYALNTGKLLHINNYDKVVIENNIRNFWALKVFGNASKYEGKIYYHLHNIPRSSGGCNKQIKKCGGFICVSKYVRNIISTDQSKIGKCDFEKTSVLLNCIDLGKFQQTYDKLLIKEKKMQLGIKPHEKVVLFSGRINSEKGVLEVIKAVSALNDDTVKLLIAGADFYGLNTTSPYEKTVKKAAAKLGNRIIFTDYVNYADMPLIYKLADVAVLPSIWDEPAGLTVIEAMASGVAVITTRSGGIPEYVGDSAILIERDEAIIENIANEIRILLYDDNKRQTLAKKGLEKTKEYGLYQYYDNFLNCIGIRKEDNTEIIEGFLKK